MSDDFRPPTVAEFLEASGLIQYWMREISTRFETLSKDTLEELLPGDANLIIKGIQNSTHIIVAAEGSSCPIAEYRLFANVAPDVEFGDIECTAHDVAWKTFEMIYSAARRNWKSVDTWPTFLGAVFGGLEPDDVEFLRLLARMERERILVAYHEGASPEPPPGKSRKRLTKPQQRERDQRIREDVRFNGLSLKDAAAKYGLDSGHISKIVNNEP